MDIVNELLQVNKSKDGRSMRINDLFSDQPEVLEAICLARTERKLSFRQISEVLSKRGEYVSEGAVQNWLRGQGIS